MKTLKIMLIASLNMLATLCSAQELSVSGCVTDALNRQLIVGATIQDANKNTFVLSDVNGKFKIASSIGNKLIITAVGYSRQELVVSNATQNVSLTPLSNILSECVVVGYDEARKMNCMPVCFSKNEDVSNEEYSRQRENRFINAGDQPLSTFALDVDRASYSNIRRYINQGQMPPKDAVRVEELINYFGYNYGNSHDGDPVSISAELAVCPWNKMNQIVRIGVKAREVDSGKLPVSNFVFLIDVSGSMNAMNKLNLVKSSIKLLCNNLRSSDKVSVVVYAGAAGVVLEPTPGSDRQKIMDAVEALHAGGSTAGGQGIELAYKMAAKNMVKGGNNRVILCTDGDFNVGVSSVDDLESLIESKRKSGIYLTVLGYGMGNYKDNKLQTLAEKGNGNYAYIDNMQEANKTLVNEFGSTMYAVAKDVKMQLEFNPSKISAYRLIGYESRMLNKEDFNDDTKDAGELGAGHTVTALYELIPVGVQNPYPSVDQLKYQKLKTNTVDVGSEELLTIKLRYKEPNSDKSKKMEMAVTKRNKPMENSDDCSFAMAVAMFGQLLRDSDFKGQSTYDDVLTLAKASTGKDDQGYRHEFIRLVETVSQLQK